MLSLRKHEALSVTTLLPLPVLERDILEVATSLKHDALAVAVVATLLRLLERDARLLVAIVLRLLLKWEALRRLQRQVLVRSLISEPVELGVLQKQSMRKRDDVLQILPQGSSRRVDSFHVFYQVLESKTCHMNPVLGVVAVAWVGKHPFAGDVDLVGRVWRVCWFRTSHVVLVDLIGPAVDGAELATQVVLVLISDLAVAALLLCLCIRAAPARIILQQLVAGVAVAHQDQVLVLAFSDLAAVLLCVVRIVLRLVAGVAAAQQVLVAELVYDDLVAAVPLEVVRTYSGLGQRHGRDVTAHWLLQKNHSQTQDRFSLARRSCENT